MDVFALSDEEFLGMEQEIPRAKAQRILFLWETGQVRLSLEGLRRTVEAATGDAQLAAETAAAYAVEEARAGRVVE